MKADFNFYLALTYTIKGILVNCSNLENLKNFTSFRDGAPHCDLEEAIWAHKKGQFQEAFWAIGLFVWNFPETA